MTSQHATTPPIAVVLMAYGTPRTPDEILPYYTDIRRGRPPTDEQLADLDPPLRGDRRHLAAGRSCTEAPARRAAGRARRPRARPVPRRARPEARRPEGRGRRSTMLAADGFEQHRRAGAGPALLGVLDRPVPRPGPRSRRARTASTVAGVEWWATEPAFVEFLAADLARRLAAMPGAHEGAVHRPLAARSGSSTPATRTPTSCGPPPRRSPRRLGLVEGTDWPIAWQSAGRTPEPWLGPDILEVIDELAADGDVDGVLVSRRAGSSPTTSRCSTTSTSRPRTRRRSTGWRSTAPPASTTTRP